MVGRDTGTADSATQRENTAMLCTMLGRTSHTKDLVASMQRIDVTPEALNITVVKQKQLWVEGVIGMVTKRKMIPNRCNKLIIIGVLGQWDASYQRGSPTLIGQHSRRMTKMLRTLREKVPNHTEIFIRSVHYNPIGDLGGFRVLLLIGVLPLSLLMDTMLPFRGLCRNLLGVSIRATGRARSKRLTQTLSWLPCGGMVQMMIAGATRSDPHVCLMWRHTILLHASLA